MKQNEVSSTKSDIGFFSITIYIDFHKRLDITHTYDNVTEFKFLSNLTFQ